LHCFVDRIRIAGAIHRFRKAMRFARFNRRDVFEHIYQTRYWGDQESASGPGSGWEETRKTREHLRIIIQSFNIGTMFDAPCGDLWWMSGLLPELHISYIGGDIAPGVVAMARSRIVDDGAAITRFDFAKDSFPNADLWLCRDALFHQPNQVALEVLKNFSRSTVRFALLTTHTNPGIANQNIMAGDFRELDLFSPPFNFRLEEVLYRFTEQGPPTCPRDMVLFSRESIAAAIASGGGSS
jgi:hypothetical protein